MTDGNVIEKRKCFVISPIGAKDSPERKAADQVLRHLIRKALGDHYAIERADDSSNPGAITPAMVASILEADLIVADLTGHNPNVFYELAMAHGYNKPTVHLQKAGEKIPFDVKDMRIVTYDMDPDDLEAAQKTLSDFARFVVENAGKAETPLTSARTFAVIQESTDPTVESNVRIIEEIARLRREVRGLVPTARSHSEKAVEPSADLRSAMRIIRRVVADDRAVPSDFEGVITPDTSQAFDSWVREGLAQVGDTNAPSDLLLSRDLRTMTSEGGRDPNYEDPFADV